MVSIPPPSPFGIAMVEWFLITKFSTLDQMEAFFSLSLLFAFTPPTLTPIRDIKFCRIRRNLIFARFQMPLHHQQSTTHCVLIGKSTEQQEKWARGRERKRVNDCTMGNIGPCKKAKNSGSDGKFCSSHLKLNFLTRRISFSPPPPSRRTHTHTQSYRRKVSNASEREREREREKRKENCSITLSIFPAE